MPRSGSTACSSTSRRASSSSSRSTSAIANSVPGGSLFWRLLVVAEAESRFTVIEEYASADPELEGYSNAVVEIAVEQGAKVEYVSRAEPLAAARGTSRRTTRGSSATPSSTGSPAASARRRGKVRIQNDLAGPGATSRVTGAYFADGTQHLDYDTFQEHIAPSTTSDFAFKGALRDSASAVWRGMIRVEEDAQKTNAYQENRNLLLSKSAHADSIPGLEILANDVRCTHGATLGQVDREQLFYLMARGLSRAEAERLIVRGFFQDVLDRIELEPVREALAAALEARIPQGWLASSEQPGGLLRSNRMVRKSVNQSGRCCETCSTDAQPVRLLAPGRARGRDRPRRETEELLGGSRSAATTCGSTRRASSARRACSARCFATGSARASCPCWSTSTACSRSPTSPSGSSARTRRS